MNAFDFLLSPAGIELTHAVILLITATAAYVAYLARRQSKQNSELLNGHIAEHTNEASDHSEASPPAAPS